MNYKEINIDNEEFIGVSNLEHNLISLDIGTIKDGQSQDDSYCIIVNIAQAEKVVEALNEAIKEAKKQNLKEVI